MSFPLVALLTSSPLMGHKKHLWNFSVLQRIHLSNLVTESNVSLVLQPGGQPLQTLCQFLDFLIRNHVSPDYTFSLSDPIQFVIVIIILIVFSGSVFIFSCCWQVLL
jgi:hypothetical protein